MSVDDVFITVNWALAAAANAKIKKIVLIASLIFGTHELSGKFHDNRFWAKAITCEQVTRLSAYGSSGNGLRVVHINVVSRFDLGILQLPPGEMQCRSNQTP